MDGKCINRRTDYDDGDIFIVMDVNRILKGDFGSICISKVVVFFCYGGSMSLDLNDKHFCVGHDNMILCYPDIVISNVAVSSDCKCFLLGFSIHAMENSFYVNERIWKTVFDVNMSPVVNLSQNEMSMMSHFAEIVRIKIVQSGNPLQKRMMHALLQAFLYEIFNIIDQHFKAPAETCINSKAQFFRRFIELLGMCNGRMRSVTDFADELCITPKYLSSVVKSNSGKTPLQWIHLYTTNVIVQNLRYTDKSIKDISNELGFTSQAFFGKFVKTHLGTSPKQYRRRFHNSNI